MALTLKPVPAVWPATEAMTKSPSEAEWVTEKTFDAPVAAPSATVTVDVVSAA